MNSTIQIKVDAIKSAMRQIAKKTGLTITFSPDGSITYQKRKLL